jgi:hypothetical protein
VCLHTPQCTSIKALQHYLLNKLHCHVCLHTQQCTSIKALHHYLPIKLSPIKSSSHNTPTKRSPLKPPQGPLINTNLNHLPTKILPTLIPTTNFPLLKIPLLHYKLHKISTKKPYTIPPLSTIKPHNSTLNLPPRATSKIGKSTMYSNAATITYITQNHTHKGKQNHLHPPQSPLHQKSQENKKQTSYKLTS